MLILSYLQIPKMKGLLWFMKSDFAKLISILLLLDENIAS